MNTPSEIVLGLRNNIVIERDIDLPEEEIRTLDKISLIVDHIMESLAVDNSFFRQKTDSQVMVALIND